MHDDPKPRGGRLRVAAPLDQAMLDALALGYVARFATSAARLAAYLARKVETRGWAGPAAPDFDRVVARMVAAGYIDDAGFARARSASLLRRGLGARRIGQALARDGIAAAERDAVLPDERAGRAAALAYARRRRLGPFGAGSAASGETKLDRQAHARQVAAMLRAGHRADHAVRVIAARDPDALEQWVEDADEV